MTLTLDVLVFGVISGALIAIGSVGFTLQYGVTNVLNLAYGPIMTSAIFVSYEAGRLKSDLALLLVVGAIWGAVFSAVLNWTIIGPFTRRGSSVVSMAMVTVGLLLIIEYTLELIQGPYILSYYTPGSSRIHIFSAIVSSTQIVLVGLAIALMLAVHIVLRHTRLGLAMRAMASDPNLTRACGISTSRVRTISWSISGALCGVTGVLLGTAVGTFNSSTGDSLFIGIVAAAVLGGVGEPYGAMLGGLLVGLVSEAAGALISPAYTEVSASVVLVLVLVLRPTGLFGQLGTARRLTA